MCVYVHKCTHTKAHIFPNSDLESAATLLQSGVREQLSWNLSVTWLRERVRELMHPQQPGQASAWLEPMWNIRSKDNVYQEYIAVKWYWGT